MAISDWRLNYQVAAFGAYATALVESIYLILGGFENASLLSISILTNGSAILVASFGGASSTPLAILRICLTSLFLLCAIILQEDQAFDGTYAILCSVAHLIYQLRLRSGDESEGFLPKHEKCAKTEALSDSYLHTPPTDYIVATEFSRSIRIFFGDYFCLEGAMVPATILGTVMTYRVFDFDLGFGLVFAFMSAFLSSVILLLINYARMRGRKIETGKALQGLVRLIIIIGPFCFGFFTSVQLPDLEFSWWRITFGIAWFVVHPFVWVYSSATSDPSNRFMFLFKTAYVACRLLVHTTLFPCAACSQREAGIQGPLTREVSTGCIWDNSLMSPALNQDKDNALGVSSTFHIRRQKGPDLVERFWFNDQEWFQISPRSFVIFLVSCIALACFSGGVLNPDGSFASIGSHVSKNTAFYITIAFTFVSTGHTPVGDSPELMFVSLRHSFPKWKAVATAIMTAMLLHFYIVSTALAKIFFVFVTPLACIIMVPLLLAGVSRRLDSAGQQLNREAGHEDRIAVLSSDEPAPSTTRAWTIDSAMVLSSPRMRCLDLRVLLLGLSVSLFDILRNQYRDEMSVTRWPISAIISIYVTGVWLYLENLRPSSRDAEPGILSLAVTALVGIFSHVNFLDVFRLYDDEREDEDFTRTMRVLNNAHRSRPVLIALWYTALLSMIVVNRKLVQQKADEALAATNERPPKQDHLLFGFHVKVSCINFVWQLRSSRVAISLVFLMLASCLGESWPLEMNTTVAGLLLFAFIVGFQLQTRGGHIGEKRSSPHVAAFGLSILIAILAVGLNRHSVFDGLVSNPKSDWKAGTGSVLIFYQLFVTVSLRLQDRRWFARPDHIEEPPTGDLQDEKATAHHGKKQSLTTLNSRTNAKQASKPHCQSARVSTKFRANGEINACILRKIAPDRPVAQSVHSLLA